MQLKHPNDFPPDTTLSDGSVIGYRIQKCGAWFIAVIDSAGDTAMMSDAQRIEHFRLVHQAWAKKYYFTPVKPNRPLGR